MLLQQDTIDKINKALKLFFNESTCYFNAANVNRFKITGNVNSKAKNIIGGNPEEVNVIKWFDNFWVYGEIRFENNNTFITFSVFQGLDADIAKSQLFRAEWDDYNSKEGKHPQPHWHITSNQVIEKTFEELSRLDAKNTFVSLLNEEKNKIVEINKMHFAMNGDWINTDIDIHPITNDNKIAKWFTGLLSHLKVQLEYVA
jgi:hypothetical protein